MTEILTESFCERCGTRYTFESAKPKARLKGVKVMSRGLKNFVLSDGTSMDEAMAAARSETDREATAYQLDAFHKTFNFCMQCRQYTCPNCWNEAEARCLTCAPNLGHEVMPAPFALAATPMVPAEDPTGGGAILVNGTNGAGMAATGGATDGFDLAARLDALTVLSQPVAAPQVIAESEVAPEPVFVAEPEIPVEPEVVPEQVFVAEPEPEVVPGPVLAVDDHDATILAAAEVAAAVTRDDAPDVAAATADAQAAKTKSWFGRFRPGQDIDAELDAYERDQAALAAAAVVASADAPVAEPEPVPQAEVVAEPVVVTAAEPEPINEAGLVVEPEVAAAAAAEIVAEPELITEALPEPEVVAAPAPELVAQPEVVAAAALVAASEPDVTAEPEPVTATPEPEPVAAVPEIVVAAALVAARTPEPVEPEIAAAAVGAPIVDDVIAQPTWQRVAPDPTVGASIPPALPDLPAAATADPSPNPEPQWPTRPAWLGDAPSVGLPFLGRPASPQGGLEALWAESNRAVVAQQTPNKPAGVRPCLTCGLSLSASARFCRRCGTDQTA